MVFRHISAARFIHNLLSSLALYNLAYIIYYMRQNLSLRVLIFLVYYDCCHLLYAEFLLFFAARGVRNVTTGITGLWPRSVQSDAAF